jgi:hypothetical protein
MLAISVLYLCSALLPGCEVVQAGFKRMGLALGFEKYSLQSDAVTWCHEHVAQRLHLAV